MVVIRLSRGGTTKRPFYHMVVTNSRNSRDGRYIERIGFYNPIAAGEEIKIQLNQERLDFWTQKGAQLSERVAYLVKNFADIASGAIAEEKLQAANLKKAKAKKESEVKAEAEAKAAEAKKEAKPEVKEEPQEEPKPENEE